MIRRLPWLGQKGDLLTRNIGLNLAGHLIPLLVAVVAIPLLTQGLGPNRFGLLALVWSLLGYVSIFDFGLGRALTQALAGGGGERAERGEARLAWTGTLALLALGLVGMLCLLGGSRYLVRLLFQVPQELAIEAQRALTLVAFAVPLVTTSAGWRGILEAYQRFDWVTYVRIPLGAVTFLGPLLILPFSQRLEAVVGALLVARLLAGLALAIFVWRLFPFLGATAGVAWFELTHLLRLGGWMTVSNLISPLLVYADRWLIGARLPLEALAHYAVPQELVTRLLVIPVAIAGVFFPVFSSAFRQDRAATAQLVETSVRGISLVLIPISAFSIALAPTALRFWVGESYAEAGGGVTRWLMVGFFLNGIAQIPFALIQGIGRPDVTARFHILEGIIYLPLLWWVLGHWGVVGAAFAWTFRVGLDAFLLLWATKRLLGESGEAVSNAGKCTLIAGIIMLSTLLLEMNFGPLIASIFCFGVCAYAIGRIYVTVAETSNRGRKGVG